MLFWLAILVAVAAMDALWQHRRSEQTASRTSSAPGKAKARDVESTRSDAPTNIARTPRRLRAAVVLLAASLVLAVFAAPGSAVFAKCVGRLAMPMGFIWLVGLVSLPLVLARSRRAGAALGCAWLAITLAGSEPLGASLLLHLEGSMWDRDPRHEEPFDAVFVMGGGVHEGPTGPSLGPSGGRAVLAARLYHRGIAHRLVASGSHVPGLERSGDGVALTETLWRELGVPADAIDRVGAAYNSRQEIALYAEYTRENGWQRVGLISSAWHLRRALRLAERHEFEPVPLPADFRGRVEWFGAYSLIPSGGGAHAIHQACWELLGAATGR